MRKLLAEHEDASFELTVAHKVEAMGTGMNVPSVHPSNLFGYVQTEILHVTNPFKKKGIDQLKKTLKKEYEKLIGTSIVNVDQAIEIKFKGVGRNETLWHNRKAIDSQLVVAVKYLPEMLTYAKLIDKSKPKPGHKKKYKATKVLTFEGKIKIGEKVQYFAITVLETPRHNFKYFIRKASIKKSVGKRYGIRNNSTVLPNGHSDNKTTKTEPNHKTGSKKDKDPGMNAPAKKTWKKSPLPFQGQKRNFIRDFSKVLENFPEDGTYIDLFGGSGLLAHTVKAVHPNATVIYNDFDGFVKRLKNIPATNRLLTKLRKITDGVVPYKERIGPTPRAAILKLLAAAEKSGYVDWITLSSSLLFSGKFSTDLESMSKESFYNRIIKNDIPPADGYLDGITVESDDYRKILKRYGSDSPIIIADPPYLNADINSYKKMTYFRMVDFLDVLKEIRGRPYIYFSSEKSGVEDLVSYLKTIDNDKNIFHGAVKREFSNVINKDASYRDLMYYRVDPDGGALNGTAQNPDTVKFNKEILKAKKEGIDPGKTFNLGNAKKELKTHTVPGKITLSVSVIKKVISGKDKAHSLTWNNLINLPDYINSPFAIFSSSTEKDSFVVLVEIKNIIGKPVMAAIKLHKKNGKDRKVNILDIRSIYSKRTKKVYQDWYRDGLLIYGNVKSDFFKPTVGPIPTRQKKSLSKHKATKTKPNRKTGPKKDKKQGLNTPGGGQPANRKPSTVRSIAATTERAPSFAVGGQTGKFLEYVEKKPKESVVVTLDGPHGSGKTTTLFRFLNDFAMAGNSCLFASLEEHPESNLIIDKKNKFLNPKAQELIDTADHFGSYQEFVDTVDYYDCIFLDSWQKLVRMIGNIRLDEDIRKRFDGKVFVIIFQRTTTGKTKGGADILYDGDIIIKLTKEAKFADNYAYFDKNRYAADAEAIRWNVQGGYVYDAVTGERAGSQAPEKTPDILSIEAVAID